jgi:prophage regulatory protein
MSEVQLGTTSRRIIRGPQVESRVGKSRVSIWRDVKAGTFPAPVQIGPNSIGWYEDEIDAWLAARPRRTYGAPAPKAA